MELGWDGRNSLPGLLRDPGFVSCTWETSALMFDIGLRHLSDLWQGRERRGLHLGSTHIPTTAGQRMHD